MLGPSEPELHLLLGKLETTVNYDLNDLVVWRALWPSIARPAVPASSACRRAITAGTDGNLWFADSGQRDRPHHTVMAGTSQDAPIRACKCEEPARSSCNYAYATNLINNEHPPWFAGIDDGAGQRVQREVRVPNV